MSSSASPAIPLPTIPSSHSPYLSQGSPAERPSSRSASRTASYSFLSPDEVARRLSTSLVGGISQVDAARRLASHGPNVLPHEEPEPLWLRFVKQFKETLILLLLASAAISAFLGNWDDAVSITVAVTIVVSVAFVQEYRSEKSLEALNRLVPHHAHVIRGNPGSRSGFESLLSPRDPVAGWDQDSRLDSTKEPLSASGKLSSTMLASQLVPGDLVLFSAGDRIPADIRITQATELSIDESNLTGENEPVRKDADALNQPDTEFGLKAGPDPQDRSPSPFYASPAAGTVGADVRLNEQTNTAFMGTLVRSGHGQGIVIATGPDTEFGAISASLNEIESPRTPLQLSMDRLGQELSYMSFAVIFIIVLVGLWQGRQLLDMFTIGVSLAVAAIPEGLPIIVTVTLALGVLRMARHGAIVRRLPSVETLGSVNVVCSDKTGTLTTNHMTVTKLWYFDVSAPLDVTKDLLASPAGHSVRRIMRIGNIANNARVSNPHINSSASAAVLSSTMSHDTGKKSRWVGQPTDVALLDFVDEFGEEDLRESVGGRVAETPFSSERKWMGVVISSTGGGDSGIAGGSSTTETIYIKGALEQVLSRCDTYLTKEGREVVLDEPRRRMALDAAETMSKEGLRVLGLASGSSRPSMNGGLSGLPRRKSSTLKLDNGPMSPRLVDESEEKYLGLTFAGLVGMNDPPRKGVEKSIRRLMAGGVKVVMITGDSEATAVAIAKRIGMAINTHNSSPNSSFGKTVLRGDELDRMTEKELAQVMAGTSIFARTSPDHKMKIIRALQSRGDVVAMTGDGVNDAPALKKADIGVAMGLLGTDVAKEAADMILTDDDFSTILGAIEEGKGIFYNIQNFLTFQLSTSVAALSLVLLSTMAGLKNPLNAMQILWINILMDGPPAQSLGVEPVDPAVMTRPPRSRSARVLTRPLIYRVLTSASVIVLGTMITYIREMSDSGTVTARDTTMTFTCFVFFDMFNALTCRSESKSLLRGQIALFGNKMFNYAVAASLAGQLAVIHLPPLQRIFQTEALSMLDLLGLLLVTSTVFWVDELRKYLFFTRRHAAAGVLLPGYSTSV